MKLNVKALALALGIIWGGAVFIMAWWATFYGPAGAVVAFAGKFYLGYGAGFTGSLIGLVWGFVDAAIGGLILAWLYNLISEKLAKT